MLIQTRDVFSVWTRAVNKTNSLVEVSDTQAASHQLGMGASLCSEDFGVCDTKAYQYMLMPSLTEPETSMPSIIWLAKTQKKRTSALLGMNWKMTKDSSAHI